MAKSKQVLLETALLLHLYLTRSVDTFHERAVGGFYTWSLSRAPVRESANQLALYFHF